MCVCVCVCAGLMRTCMCMCVYAYDTDVRRYGWTGRLDREGGSCPDREMRIVSVYELSGVGEQIAQSN